MKWSLYRYGQDMGVVLEECSPYEGRDDSCRTRTNCARHYTAAYRYVGGQFLQAFNVLKGGNLGKFYGS